VYEYLKSRVVGIMHRLFPHYSSFFLFWFLKLASINSNRVVVYFDEKKKRKEKKKFNQNRNNG